MNVVASYVVRCYNAQCNNAQVQECERRWRRIRRITGTRAPGFRMRRNGSPSVRDTGTVAFAAVRSARSRLTMLIRSGRARTEPISSRFAVVATALRATGAKTSGDRCRSSMSVAVRAVGEMSIGRAGTALSGAGDMTATGTETLMIAPSSEEYGLDVLGTSLR